jgi:hypothetical protein
LARWDELNEEYDQVMEKLTSPPRIHK